MRKQLVSWRVGWLIQEKMSGPETLLTLYVASDEELHALQPQLRRRQLPVIRVGTRYWGANEPKTRLTTWGDV